jgi:hypothetical protein
VAGWFQKIIGWMMRESNKRMKFKNGLRIIYQIKQVKAIKRSHLGGPHGGS